MSGDRDSGDGASPAGGGPPRRHVPPSKKALAAILTATVFGCARPAEPELQMVFEVQGGGGAAAERVEQTAAAFRRRLDLFGIDGSVEVQPGNRVAVRLPGVDPERVALMRTRAAFELRLVRFPEGGLGLPSREAVLEHFGGALPGDVEVLAGPQRDEHGKVTGEVYYAVERRPLVTGSDLAGARPDVGQLGDPIVLFRLQPAAAAAFGDATERNVGRNLAIVLDGRVVSAPIISARIGEHGVIQGGFTGQEAQDIASLLGAGALPPGVKLVEQRLTGPGTD